MTSQRFSLTQRVLPLLLLVLSILCAQAEQVTYYIKEYNSKLGTFILSASGMRPAGSYADFESKYGATTGNRYNQIPRNQQATLWLMGWQGCTIEGITLSMCSNNASGTAGLSITVGEEECYGMRPAEFASEQWFGRWVSKDHVVYVDVEKPLPAPITVGADAEVGITIKGGTQEGSVYLNAITIDYSTPGTTEVPLGWSYEKVEAKGKLAEGDVVMLYRSGDAAGDIDGMQAQKYLDAIGVNSTANVDDPFITLFTLQSAEEGNWKLINQYGETLGATGAQSLAWDDGVDTWNITLGYDGATIASTHTKYGTMRYNAPSGSYPRFWNYTSKSLPLPYIYRRTRQQQPVVSTSLVLADTERRVRIAAPASEGALPDTLVLRATLLPATATDRRIRWTSSDEEVAVVRSGIVELLCPGETTITATSADGGCSAQCHLIVETATEGIELQQLPASAGNCLPTLPELHWDLSGKPQKSRPSESLYIDALRRVYFSR